MGIMGHGKPLASLSSGLLARKGQARPAMRAQGFASLIPATAPAEDDLGWNDMGTGAAAAPSPVLPSVPPASPPPVLVERETLAREVAAPVAPVSAAAATEIGRQSARQTQKGKAAFTLRLAPDRHLRLRLASAVTNRSAQMLVAEALDRLIDTIPEVEALAAQLPQNEVSR
jgi:hypothetical protein